MINWNRPINNDYFLTFCNRKCKWQWAWFYAYKDFIRIDWRYVISILSIISFRISVVNDISFLFNLLYKLMKELKNIIYYCKHSEYPNYLSLVWWITRTIAYSSKNIEFVRYCKYNVLFLSAIVVIETLIIGCYSWSQIYFIRIFRHSSLKSFIF
jgi:predicted house-cleaning noncanonical NTP pyrophosphatase (MazG superfamily)